MTHRPSTKTLVLPRNFNFKEDYFNYLNVGDCTRGNENDSSSLFGYDSSHNHLSPTDHKYEP